MPQTSSRPRLGLSYAAGPADPPERNRTIGQALREAAAAAPDRVALTEGVEDPADRRRWTYSQLLADAEAYARALARRFPVGSSVAIWAPNVVEYQVLQYGIALAGMVLVTVNPAFREPEARYVLQQSQAVACFTVVEFRGRPLLDTANRLRDELPDLQTVLDIEHCGDLRVFDDTALPQVPPEAPAQILYTSGTTGAPKGAVLTHRGITNNVADAALRIVAGRTDDVVWLAALPMFHLAGCVVAAVGTLSLCGTLLTVRSFDAGLVLRLLQEERISTTNLVPTLAYRLLDHPDFPATDRSSLHSLMLGGATIPAELVRRVERLGLVPVVTYGLTEAAVITGTLPGDDAADKVETCGPALPHVEVRVCDADSGALCPLGVVGELQTRGSLTLQGYFRNPEATAAALDPDGWLRTGDLATMDDRGYVRITGRSKDVIIRGGENIYPREIEDRLMEVPGVADAAVVGVPDEVYGEIAVAFVRRKPDCEVTARALRDALATELSGYKIPAAWCFLDAFPQTPSGKVQKFALRDAWQRGEHRAEPFD